MWASPPAIFEKLFLHNITGGEDLLVAAEMWVEALGNYLLPTLYINPYRLGTPTVSYYSHLSFSTPYLTPTFTSYLTPSFTSYLTP